MSRSRKVRMKSGLQARLEGSFAARNVERCCVAISCAKGAPGQERVEKLELVDREKHPVGALDMPLGIPR